jgi:hypothetical protein
MSQARKNRKKERKHMEDFLPEMASDGEYYSCSNTQEHSKDCLPIDESHEAWEYGYKRLLTRGHEELGCLTVTKWDVAIFYERAKWKDLAPFSTANITVDQFDLAIKVKVLFDIILEKGIIEDQAEADTFYQQHLYRELKFARENMTPAIQEMRRKAIAAPQGFMPPRNPLLGPDGRPL